MWWAFVFGDFSKSLIYGPSYLAITAATHLDISHQVFKNGMTDFCRCFKKKKKKLMLSQGWKASLKMNFQVLVQILNWILSEYRDWAIVRHYALIWTTIVHLTVRSLFQWKMNCHSFSGLFRINNRLVFF